jgi:hypothetical protein
VCKYYKVFVKDFDDIVFTNWPVSLSALLLLLITTSVEAYVPVGD